MTLMMPFIIHSLPLQIMPMKLTTTTLTTCYDTTDTYLPHFVSYRIVSYLTSLQCNVPVFSVVPRTYGTSGVAGCGDHFF